uniref:protein PHYTOCHROME KINASE SUBSTRATE 1-like n=1 Tax=Erigeron canadensis TaxID=72917 RepID=UPI001CB9691D|nr:protein PHYTOCHROME KINASE SUBSTRATE 1-like [Erigeron canadensis]
MIASDKRVSLFGNNVDHQDASFSSYLKENNTTVLKFTHPPHINTKKMVEDGEIGIFGAEKYFKGAMDEQISRTPNSIKSTNYHPKDSPKKDEAPPKPKTGSATPSVRSEASWNSRSGLLANGGNQRIRGSRREKSSSVKNLLVSLGCNCNDKASIKIVENKAPAKEPVKPPANLAGGFNDNKLNIKKEDCFAFPVLNTCPPMKNEVNEEKGGDIIHVQTRRNSLEVFGSPKLEKGKKSFSLERKLTMLNWDGVTPRAENIDIIGENDAASDASSDLFEIESFSTNGNNSFLTRQVSNGRSSNATLPNGYAPSEASIAWSVVTASVAGYSIISDYEDTKTSKNHNMANSRNVKAGGGDHMERMIKGSGILSGCNSHKSVRVAGEHVVVSGGDKVVVTSGTTTKERFRLDSMVPIMKLQPETKPMSSLTRGHSPRSSNHLYIQQQ